MQYLLTQEEYDALHRKKTSRTEAEKSKLQALCTLAAQHIPLAANEWADRTPKPWGCILGPREQSPGYCDSCPATEVCPYEFKKWSQ